MDSQDGHELGRLVVPSGPNAPQVARLAVAEWLGSLLSKRVLQDAQLLISELVTNSVRHAGAAVGAPITICASSSGPAILFSVCDDGRRRRVERGRPRGDGGLGLNLVEAVSSRWGVSHNPGTEVWFELR